VFTDYKINITCLQGFSQLSCLKLLFELNDKRGGVPALRRSLLNLNTRSNALAVGIIDFSVPTKIALEKNLQGGRRGRAFESFQIGVKWFVSETNSLKASALLESPLAFRASNIFVHANFLVRA
jgi:hypothetical protein